MPDAQAEATANREFLLGTSKKGCTAPMSVQDILPSLALLE